MFFWPTLSPKKFETVSVFPPVYAMLSLCRARRHESASTDAPKMDVTAANFDAAAELLESLLPTCSFYAIDEEMTGIMLNKETAPSMADTCEQRYAKMKRVVMPHEARTPH